MIKKILKYLAFWLDNLISNLIPSKNQYKRWDEVEDFKKSTYSRVGFYLYVSLIVIACYYSGWKGLLIIPGTLIAYGIYYYLDNGFIYRKTRKTRKNGKD